MRCEAHGRATRSRRTNSMGLIAEVEQAIVGPAGDTRRPAAVDAMGVALVRAVPASLSARLCRGRNPLGRKCIERRAAPASAVHGLRTQGRYAVAIRVGLASTSALSRSRCHDGRSVQVVDRRPAGHPNCRGDHRWADGVLRADALRRAPNIADTRTGRLHAVVSFRANARVADLDARQQAGER